MYHNQIITGRPRVTVFDLRERDLSVCCNGCCVLWGFSNSFVLEEARVVRAWLRFVKINTYSL